MNLQQCPECGSELQSGWINSGGIGIYWMNEPRTFQWIWQIWSKSIEMLQKDWWSSWKLAKDNLPAQRCSKCRLVLFKSTADE